MKAVRVVAAPDAVRQVRASVSPRSRWPHHSSSTASMIGRATVDESGAVALALGECVLANGATLVLSDLPEWRRETIEAVALAWREQAVTLRGHREPIRVRSYFDVVATHELCPCGMRGRENVRCACSAPMLRRWLDRCRDFVRVLQRGGKR